MSTQHTPGEWRISGVSQEDGSIFIAKNQIVICYVTNAASIFEVVLKQTPETQFANARLIAAAPDMYEALKSIDARLRECMAIGLGLTAADVYDSFYREIVRAALAKASGESK